MKKEEKELIRVSSEEAKKLRELGFKVFVLDDQNQIGGIIDEIRTT